jgi:hypothetical protein
MVIKPDRGEIEQEPLGLLFERQIYVLHLPRFNENPVVHRSSTEHRFTSSFHVSGENAEHRLTESRSYVITQT